MLTFADRSHVGIMKHQRLIVATSGVDTHPRARLPAVKMLPGTRKVKGASYIFEMHADVMTYADPCWRILTYPSDVF
jgi:hypothetical protein